MKLNQIIITGDTNREYPTQIKEEPIYPIDKSVQVYFRNKITHLLLEVTAPIFEKLNNSGKFEKDVLFGIYEPKPKIKRRKVEDDSIDHCTVLKFSRFYTEEDEFPEPKAEKLSEKERLLRYDYQTYYDLYEYTFPKIAYTIIKEGGDKQGAGDIFQNALIVLLERLKTDDFVLTGSAGNYLHSVSVNIWRNLRRKMAQRVIKVEISDYSDNLKESIYFEEIPNQFEKVAAILERMGNPCKALLESFYFNQLSWEAIAEKFGYSTAASARNQKYKCLERIRKEIT